MGANRAGKTTLVKLLARLYEPSAGRITVDGVDVRDLDLGSWRPGCPSSSRTSCATSSPLATTWAWGGRLRMHDQDRLWTAVERSESRQLIEALPRGWDTTLSRGYVDGADLSGGEWQRVALARP